MSLLVVEKTGYIWCSRCDEVLAIIIKSYLITSSFIYLRINSHLSRSKVTSFKHFLQFYFYLCSKKSIGYIHLASVVVMQAPRVERLVIGFHCVLETFTSPYKECVLFSPIWLIHATHFCVQPAPTSRVDFCFSPSHFFFIRFRFRWIHWRIELGNEGHRVLSHEKCRYCNKEELDVIQIALRFFHLVGNFKCFCLQSTIWLLKKNLSFPPTDVIF